MASTQYFISSEISQIERAARAIEQKDKTTSEALKAIAKALEKLQDECNSKARR